MCLTAGSCIMGGSEALTIKGGLVLCKSGDKCPKSHDPTVMANENGATKDSQCHAFAADDTCRFGKNCRFSHGATDFRRALLVAV